jgi:hypothetical protein
VRGLDLSVRVTTDLRALAREIGAEVGDVIRATARDIHYGVVDKTPHLHGTARANWRVSLSGIGNEFRNFEHDPISEGQAAQIAKGSFQRIRRGTVRAGDRITIYNNTPYIYELELGTSRKAPQGMVAITLAEVDARLAAGQIRLSP